MMKRPFVIPVFFLVSPSNGAFTITSFAIIPTKEVTIHAAVYDLSGRAVWHKRLSFDANEATIDVQAAKGSYILELKDEEGNTTVK